MLTNPRFAYQAESAYRALESEGRGVVDAIYDLLPQLVAHDKAKIHRNDGFPVEYKVTAHSLTIVFILKSDGAVIVDLR